MKKIKNTITILTFFFFLISYFYNNYNLNKNLKVIENFEIEKKLILENEIKDVEVKVEEIKIENPIVESANLTKFESPKIYKISDNLYKVTKVVDGDTVHVKSIDGNILKIRMMAANTLEKDSPVLREKCFANMATTFTIENLLNKNVYMFGDKTQPKLDKYGRTLAYVLSENDDKFFNERLMETGLSKTYKASPPATEWKKYENIRAEMEKQKKGIWDENLCKV